MKRSALRPNDRWERRNNGCGLSVIIDVSRHPQQTVQPDRGRFFFFFLDVRATQLLLEIQFSFVCAAGSNICDA